MAIPIQGNRSRLKGKSKKHLKYLLLSLLLVLAACTRSPAPPETEAIVAPPDSIVTASISFESHTNNITNPPSGNAATTLTINKPADVNKGDFLLAQITFEKGVDAGTDATLTPSNWTLVQRTNHGSDFGQAIFYKVAGTAEPHAYTWSFNQAVKAAGGIFRYTGVDTTNPIVASSGNSGDSSTLTALSVNAEANSMLVGFFGFKKKDTTLSVPSGMTGRYNFQNPQDVTIRAADELRTTAGPTGNRVSTPTPGNSDKWVAQLVTLRTGSQMDADLPAPWLAANVGDATGASAYHAQTDSFSLSATGTGSLDAHHYVYQPLAANGMIIGRVLELTTDNPTASAGLMLRQDNGASSAYALVALTPEGIRFEYREGGEDVIRMAGRTAAAPVWLKLERKEDRVYAYESDDGVSWTLVAGITLSLANPYHAGLAISSTTTTQANFQEVQVQGDISADFSASPASGTVPLSVQFAATPDDPALTYQWDFGDDTAAIGAQVSHTFTSPGAYFVRLTVSQGQTSETVGRHVIVQSQKQADGYYTVNPGDTIVGVDGVTFVTLPSYATGPSRLRIEVTEATALPEDVPSLILQSYERLVSPYYEVFSPDVDEVANPDYRERLFYIGMPVPEGVDGRRVTIYGAGYGMVLCEPAEGGSCISGEQYSWNDFSSDGFYHPASNMYYTPVPNYPSGRPEYFVMLEWTGSPRNILRETLPWEDSASNLNLITPFQVDAEPVDIDAAESENFVIRCNRNFERNNSTVCTDLAEDIVGVAQDAYDYLRRHGFGAPYSRTSADGRHVIDVHPIVADPDGDGRRCADGPAVNGRVNFLRRTHQICLELNHTSITGTGANSRTYTIAHEMFHDVAHNPNVVRSYPRPLEWWLEGTATLAAGTIRGCTGNPQCQEIQLDPRPRWGLPRLDIGFFDETSYQGYDAHPYRLQEFWLYLATEAGATNLGFLLPLFEVEGGPSATLFDTLLQNGDMNGFVVEGGFAELHYNWVTSILGHTDDSTGGGYGDEDRVCTTCAVPDGNRFGNTTGILPDAEGNAAIAVDLAPLSTAIYRLELADGQILADVIAGLDLNDPNGHLIYFLFEAREMGVDVVYLVVVNTNIDPAGGTSSGVFNLSLKVPDADTNPCQGAACPDAEPSDGSSWGDPHIFTFDGGTYTFMATGDYILSESTDPNDDFVVQVRFRPFEGPTWAHVDSTQWSANEAVAMNINGDIVEFYAVDDYTQPLAIINGTEVPTGDAVIPLPNGGTVTLKGRRASASWPDGTSLTAELNTSLRGDWSIAGRVNLSLPASRWNKVQGLMGNNDGIVKNDLRLRDGTQLSLDPTPQAYNFSSEQLTQELYSGPFRSSWLVQSYESLFSRGTNRYDPFYPSEFVSLDTLDPSLIAIAEHACGLQGVTSAAVLSRCVLDVANTGDEIFAVLAAAVDPQTLGITLSPSAIYFTRSESRELTAFVRGQVDNRNVIWSASAGSISGSGNTITYMPPSDKGEYTVTATLVADPSISATATIIVGEPLVIAPNTVTLSAESSQTFTAFGAEGQSVVWSASGGYISGSGRTITYTAPDKAGDYTVTASLAVDSRVQATATVRVYGSKLTPFITTLKPGDSREFTWLNAEGLEPTWSVTGGSITGSGHSVTYTAPAAEGEYTITATSSLDPNLRATARVFVTEKEVATILYYADYFLSTDYLGQAMRPYNVTYAESWWDFDEKLASGEFDLAIALVQNWFDYPDVDIMTEHVNRGGRVIYTDWAHDFRFNELFEFRHSGWVNFNTMVLHSPFDEGLSNPMHLINPGWYIYSMGLEPIGSGQSFCTFASSNYSCLVVGNEGRTIVLGFLADVPVANGGEQLFSNIVNFFNVAFEPASSTSFGNSSAAEEPTFAPSGKADETELCYPANNLLCQTSP